jgi:hypothetical protein
VASKDNNVVDKKEKENHYNMIDIAPKCVENYINNTTSNI